MDTIWGRVFYPALAIGAIGFVAFVGLDLWIPTILSEDPMLIGIASLSRNAAPFVLGGFCTWASCYCAPRYFAVRRWLYGTGTFCVRCSGPTIVQWERYKPHHLCLQCGLIKSRS
jgi:hypothetical protein